MKKKLRAGRERKKEMKRKREGKKLRGKST